MTDGPAERTDATSKAADAYMPVQRWCLAAMLLLSSVLILPSAVEPFMLPKLTAILVLTLVMLAAGLMRVSQMRRLHLPLSLVTAATAFFFVALVVATVTSPQPWTSLLGYYGRYMGLLPYVAYLAVFLVALRVTDMTFLRLLNRVALVALGLVVFYGLLQTVGLEPITYRGGLSPEFSFLGNVNFSGAWAGALCAVALVTAMTTTERRGWRIAGAGLVPLTLLYTVQTSFQGPVVALVASATAVAVLLTSAGGRLRTAMQARPDVARRAVVAAAAFAVVLVVGAFAVVRRPLADSLSERLVFWRTARDIFADNVFFGTGLDTFAHHYLAYRPSDAAVTTGPVLTDNPHSVPIAMFSNGGLLLGIAWLAVIVAVAAVLLRGLRHAEGPHRLALAAWGGVWVGYLLQSLVSFDVPPLAFLHWLSAGVVVAVAAPPRWREVRLPGRPPARPTTKKGQPYGDVVVPAATRAAQAALVALCLLAVWPATWALRADLVAGSAEPLTRTGQYEAAAERFRRAADLNPGEASYLLLEARAHEANGAPGEALAAAAEAAGRDPGPVQYPIVAGQRAVEAGDDEAAVAWFAEALRRDPNDPPVLQEAAQGLLAIDRAAEAELLIERLLTLRTTSETLLLLGQARFDQGDRAGALAVVEQVLERDPTNATAQEILSRLGDSS